MNGRKKPLYRKVNTRTRGVFHHRGGRSREERNTKAAKTNEAMRGSMHQGQQRGLDYTPLFRFLLSKVGEDWDVVHSEAVSRLDKEEPIWWMVARTEDKKPATVGIGESTYFSGLYVDENNRLAIVDPSIKVEDLEPDCSCCTHTFNGVPFVKKFRGWWERE
ncbi:MAG: hypothetical protein AAGD43_29560 [Pseudomonadota bacterium]